MTVFFNTVEPFHLENLEREYFSNLKHFAKCCLQEIYQNQSIALTSFDFNELALSYKKKKAFH